MNWKLKNLRKHRASEVVSQNISLKIEISTDFTVSDRSSPITALVLDKPDVTIAEFIAASVKINDDLSTLLHDKR